MAKIKQKKIGNTTINYIEASETSSPLKLTKLQFIRLLQQFGGLTMQKTVEATSDPNLAYFWFLADITGAFEYDDPSLGTGLDTLYALGYIPLGKQSIMDHWPHIEVF